jgi:hypothetical protein
MSNSMSPLCFKRKRRKGSILAEMPATMYLIFFGLLLPLIGMATIGYRISLAYFAVKDSCYKAAKSATFSTPPNSAVSNAAAAWAQDTAAWNGITGTYTISIVTQPIAGGTETISTTKLPTTPAPNTALNMYFIRLVATCQVQPFFPAPGGWMGLQVPGLTKAYPMTMKYQYYVENTAGLTQ